MFANSPGDLGSIPGRVIPKTFKMVLDSSLLNTQHYKVRIKVKWRNPGKEVSPSPTPSCSSYRKESLRVTLDYDHQLYLFQTIHHHLVMLPGRMFLALSRHHSLSFIATVRSSGLHPLSSQSCLYVGPSWSPCFCSAMWRGS